MSWSGAIGRVYDVFCTVGPLGSASWQPVPGCTNISGTSGPMQIDLGDRVAAFEYFKVRVRR